MYCGLGPLPNHVYMQCGSRKHFPQGRGYMSRQTNDEKTEIYYILPNLYAFRSVNPPNQWVQPLNQVAAFLLINSLADWLKFTPIHTQDAHHRSLWSRSVSSTYSLLSWDWPERRTTKSSPKVYFRPYDTLDIGFVHVNAFICSIFSAHRCKKTFLRFLFF